MLQMFWRFFRFLNVIQILQIYQILSIQIINDLKPDTHCDSLDLETGLNTVPAILLSPASNEGIEIEEKVFLKEQYFDNSYHDNDDEKEVDQQLIKIDKSKSEDEISTVGPIIQVTDCDNEKSNSSGLIAASCIIAVLSCSRYTG